MKHIAFIFLFITSLISYNGEDLSDVDKFNIVFGEGFGKIKIHEITKGEIDSILGPGERLEFFERDYAITFLTQKYVYKELGIELEYQYKTRKRRNKLPENETTDSLVQINFVSPCAYTTNEGIGIGSKRKDVDSVYGKPLLEWSNCPFEDYREYEFCYKVQYCNTEIVYHYKDSKDTANHKVKEIRIMNGIPLYIYRKEHGWCE